MSKRTGTCRDCVHYVDYCKFFSKLVNPDAVCIGKYSHFESQNRKSRRGRKRLTTSFRPDTVRAMLHAIGLGIRSHDFDIGMATHIKRALKQLRNLEQKHKKIKLASTP